MQAISDASICCCSMSTLWPSLQIQISSYFYNVLLDKSHEHSLILCLQLAALNLNCSYITDVEFMHPAKHKQFIIGFMTLLTFDYQESMLGEVLVGPRRQHFLLVNAEPAL